MVDTSGPDSMRLALRRSSKSKSKHLRPILMGQIDYGWAGAIMILQNELYLTHMFFSVYTKLKRQGCVVMYMYHVINLTYLWFQITVGSLPVSKSMNRSLCVYQCVYEVQ